MIEMKKKALNRAMQLCSRSEKCTKDIREKLKQWKVETSLHEEIIIELSNEKFLDDARYAQSYVKDKIFLNKWGKQKVRFALKIKEIEDRYIDEAIAAIDTERYEKVLEELLVTKYSSIRASSDYERIGKLIRFAQSRGFDISEINKTLNNII